MEQKHMSLARKIFLAALTALMCAAVVLGVMLPMRSAARKAPVEAQAAVSFATAADLAQLGYSMYSYELRYTGSGLFNISLNGKTTLCQAGTTTILQILQKGQTRYFFFNVKSAALSSGIKATPITDDKTNPHWDYCELTSAWNNQFALFLPQLNQHLLKDDAGRIFFNYYDELTKISKTFYLGANGYTDSASSAATVTKTPDTLLDAYLIKYSLETWSTTYTGSEITHPLADYFYKNEIKLLPQATILPSGTTKATDSKSYSFIVLPNTAYKWTLGTDYKTISWKINKADPSNGAASGVETKQRETIQASTLLTEDGSKLSVLKAGGDGGTFTVTSGDDGVVSVSGSNGGQDLSAINLTGGNKKGSTTVKIEYSGGTNLNDKTWTVNVTNSLSAEIYAMTSAGRKTYDSLQAAIDDAANNGGKLFVNGAFEVNEAVEIPDGANITIQPGDNADTMSPELHFGAEGSLTVNGGTLNFGAEGDGYGVKISSSGGGVTVEGGTLNLNDKTTFTGGGLTVKGGNVAMSGNVTFDSCASEGNGGALNITGGSVTLADGANIEISNCTASGDGGAIYVDGGAFDAASGALSVTSSGASGKGGAIYVGAGGGDVVLGANTAIKNNSVAKGNGVYVEDGAKLTLSTQGAAGITDGIMLGHDPAKPEDIAQIELEGEAPSEGETIVVEFEDAAAQLDPKDTHNQYITSDTLNSAELKSFMRVKNAGYTFDPEANDGSLGLMESGSRVAAVQKSDGTYEFFTNVQAAIEYVATNGGKGTVYLTTYENSSNPALNTTEVVLDATLNIPSGADITFKSGKITADDQGGMEFSETTETPVVLKRDPSLLDEMIKVEAGGSLTLGNVTLDGGATWDEGMSTPKNHEAWDLTNGKIKIADDGNCGAGTVETNNTGTTAHAPVIVNEGTLTLGEGSTIQNNDNNYATPGLGFGSENYGGGVRNQRGGGLTMKDGATIRDCYSREGGAIMNVNKNDPENASGVKRSPKVTIEGGTITGNVSQTKGAAIQNVYGGATTTVSGGSIMSNASLADLGVLTAEEGASLTVSGGTVSAEGKNALYLYNQYSAETYSAANSDAKPFIEGNGAGSLTVSGTPSITGNVHVDGGCYLVDVEKGADVNGNYAASATYYETYVDVSKYEGAGLTVTTDTAAPAGDVMVDGKIAKLPAGADLTEWASKLGIKQDPAESALEGSFTFVYTDEAGTWLAQGSYALEVTQSEPNMLNVSGTVDENCTGITVEIGGETYTLEVKDGVVSGEIDLTAYAQDAENGDLKATVTFGYGENKDAVTVEEVALQALLKNAEGFVYPENAQYQKEDGGFANAPADGTLPDDADIDPDGKATFKWSDGGPEVEITVGTREEAPVFNREGEESVTVATLTDVTDKSLTFTVGEGKDLNGNDLRGLEYALVDEDGNVVSGWTSPDKDGKLDFSGLTAEKKYSLQARVPAKEGTLPSNPTSATGYYYTLTTAQQTAKETFESAFGGLFDQTTDGEWQLKDKDPATTAADLNEVRDKYAALETAMENHGNMSDEDKAVIESVVRSLEQERYEALEAAYEEACANEWFEKYSGDLKKAMEYAEGTDLFEGINPPQDAELETLKGKLEEAQKTFEGLPAFAQVLARELLQANGPDSVGSESRPLSDPLAAYLGVAVKEMEAKVGGIEDEALKKGLGDAFLTMLRGADSIAAAKNIESNFSAAQTAAEAVKKAYDEAAKGNPDGRAKTYLDQKLGELYAEIVKASAEATGAPDYSSTTGKAENVFGLAAKIGAAQDAFIEAFDQIFGDYDGFTTNLFTQDEDGNTVIDPKIFDEYGVVKPEYENAYNAFLAAQRGLDRIGKVESADKIAEALKNAVKELLQGTTTVEGTDLGGSVMRAGDSKAVKDYLNGLAQAVGELTATGENLPDVLSVVRSTGEDNKNVQEELEGKRNEERENALRDYRDTYELLTGETLGSDEYTAAIESTKDCAAVNAALKAAVDALLEGMKNGASEALQTHIDGLLSTVERTVATAEDTENQGAGRTLAKLFEVLKTAETTRLTASKDAAEEAFKKYYEALTGATDVTGNAQWTELESALGGITLDDTNVPAALKAVDQALKEAVNGVLESLIEDGDSQAVKDYIAEVQKNVNSAADYDDLNGIHDLTEMLEGVTAALADQRGKDVAAAQQALVEAYNAAMGTNYTVKNGELSADAPEALKEAFGEVAGENLSAALGKVEELLNGTEDTEGLLGALADEAADSDAVNGKVTAAKEAVKDAIAAAKEAGAAPSAWNGLNGVADDIAAQRASEQQAAFAEYKEAYEAITGGAYSDKIPESLENATNCKELNAALAAEINDLFDALVEGDSKAVKNLKEAAKSAVNGVIAGEKHDTVADFSATVEAQKKAIDDQRAKEKDEAKATYSEFYEALNGTAPNTADVDQLFKDATNCTELNEALQDAMNNALADYVDRANVSDGATIESNIKSKIDGVFTVKNDSVPAASDFEGAIKAAKEQVLKARAKDEYIESYKALTGATEEAAKAAGEAFAEGLTSGTAADINDALKEAVNELVENYAREGDSKAVKDLVAAAQEAIEAAGGTAADDIIDVSEEVVKQKGIIDAKRAEEKTAAFKKYQEAYKAITGGTYSDKMPESLQNAKDCTALNNALKYEVNKLLEALTKDEPQNVKAVTEAAKQAVEKAVAAANGSQGGVGLADLTETLGNVKNDVEKQRAINEFAEAYAAVTGESPDDAALEKLTESETFKGAATTADINAALKAAIEEVIGSETGTNLAEAQAALKAALANAAGDNIKDYSAALDGAKEKLDFAKAQDDAAQRIENAYAELTGTTYQDRMSEEDLAALKQQKEEAKKAIGEAVLEKGASADWAAALEAATEQLTSDTEAAIEALDVAAMKAVAKQEYLDSLKAMGVEAPNPSAFEEAIKDLTTASDINKQLKQAVTAALDTLVSEDDSAAVQEIVEGVKSKIGALDENSATIVEISDCCAKVEMGTPAETVTVAEAIADRRAEEIKAAQDSYTAAYEALTGNKTDATQEPVKSALDAIGKAQNMKGANDALKAQVDNIYGGMAREGDSKAVKELIEKAKKATENAIDAANTPAQDGGRKIPDLGTEKVEIDGAPKTLAEVKQAIDDQRASEKQAAFDEYKEAYKAITGGTYSDKMPESFEKAEDCKALNEALAKEVSDLFDEYVKDSSDTVKATEKEESKKLGDETGKATASGEIADLTKTVAGIKDEIDLRTAKEAAEKEIEDAYKGLDTANMTPAEKEELDALKEQAKQSIEDTVIGEGTLADAEKAIADIVENAKDDMARKEAEGLAKQEYLDSYKAVTGKDADPAQEPAQSVLSAIEAAAQNKQDEDYVGSVNEELQKGVEALFDEYVKDSSDTVKATEKEESKKLGDETGKATANGEIADLADTVAGIKDEIDLQTAKEAAEKQIDEAYAGLDAANMTPAEKAELDALKEQAKKAIEDTVIGEGTLADAEKAIDVAVEKALDDMARKEAEGLAKQEYLDSYKAVTGKDADPAQEPAKGVLAAIESAAQNKQDEDFVGAVNEALKEGVEALLDGLRNEDGAVPDSAAVKEIVDAAQKAVDDAIQGAEKIPDISKLVENVKEDVEKQRESELNDFEGKLDDLLDGKQYPEDLAAQAQEIVEAAKEAAREGGDRGLIEEKAKAQLELLDKIEEFRTRGEGVDPAAAEKKLQDAIDRIGSAERAEDIDGEKAQATLDAEKEYAKEQLLGELTSSDAQTVKDVVTGTDGFNGKIDAAESADDVKALVEAAESAIEGERFLQDNEVLNKDFGDLGVSDKSDLEAARGGLGGLSEGAKKYLDEKSGYSALEKEIEDKINKADFEQKKAETLTEADKLVREHDGAYVKEVFEAARGDIENVEYDAHTDDATRDGHKEQTEKKLEDAAKDAEQKTLQAQEVQRAVSEVEAELNDRIESGCYNDAQKQQLKDIFAQFKEDAERIPAAGEGGKTGSELLEARKEEALGKFGEVPVVGVAKGDIKVDKTASVEGGTGDYGKDHDGTIWGIVTNDSSMPGGIRLVIEEVEEDGMREIESAANQGKLTAAAGSEIEAKDLKAKVTGKELISTLDIYLITAQGGKITEFEGRYKIMLLMPAEMRDMSGLTVVYKNDDGSVEVYATSISEDGKYLEFTTDHFSEFAILADKVVDISWLILLLYVIFALEIVAMVILLLVRKRGGTENRGEKAASVLPLGLLAVITLPYGGVTVCILLGVCVALGALALGLAVGWFIKSGKSEQEAQEQETQAPEENGAGSAAQNAPQGSGKHEA